MKKSIVLVIAAILVALSFITSIAKNTLLPKGSEEVTALKNSTLMVVLLEENSKYIDKLYKLHKPLLVKAYQAAVKSYNDNIQAIIAKNLHISADIQYKTMDDIIDIPLADRLTYSYLVLDRSMQASGPGVLTDFAFDFYASDKKELQGMVNDYQDFMQFECADPKYHGEDDYRRLDVIVKGKKMVSDQLFAQSLDMIIPTNGSLLLCIKGLQKQFDDALAGNKKVSKDELKQELRNEVAIARKKTLLICKDNLDKNITDVKIKPVYKYNIKIVSRDEFDNAIVNKDSTCCLLVVYPADKFLGDYKPAVDYQHLIVDGQTSEVLLTVVSPVAANGMVASYQKVNDKHFKDILKTEEDAIK